MRGRSCCTPKCGALRSSNDCAVCRRTVDHTGPYVRMLLERLRSPKSLHAMPPPPTAAGALEVHFMVHALLLNFDTLAETGLPYVIAYVAA